MIRGLFLNHNHPNGICGIYHFGERIANILSHNNYFKCDKISSYNEALDKISLYKPNIIILNCHNEYTKWINNSGFRFNNIKTIGFYHEVSQNVIDSNVDNLFDYYLCSDLSLKMTHRWFKITRPLSKNSIIRNNINNSIPTIGSFGFFLPQKGFDTLIDAVNNEFDEAIINIHAPIAHSDARDQLEISDYIDSLYIKCKPNIRLNLDMEYIYEDSLIDKLSNNDINVFLYSDNKRNYNQNNSGVSGVFDTAVPAGKPILINNSNQFRHVRNIFPIWPDCSIKNTINSGSSKIEEFFNISTWEKFNLSLNCIAKEILEKSNYD